MLLILYVSATHHDFDKSNPLTEPALYIFAYHQAVSELTICSPDQRQNRIARQRIEPRRRGQQQGDEFPPDDVLARNIRGCHCFNELLRPLGLTAQGVGLPLDLLGRQPRTNRPYARSFLPLEVEVEAGGEGKGARGKGPGQGVGLGGGRD